MKRIKTANTTYGSIYKVLPMVAGSLPIAVAISALHETGSYWAWGVGDPFSFLTKIPIPLTEILSSLISFGILFIILFATVLVLVCPGIVMIIEWGHLVWLSVAKAWVNHDSPPEGNRSPSMMARAINQLYFVDSNASPTKRRAQALTLIVAGFFTMPLLLASATLATTYLSEGEPILQIALNSALFMWLANIAVKMSRRFFDSSGSSWLHSLFGHQVPIYLFSIAMLLLVPYKFGIEAGIREVLSPAQPYRIDKTNSISQCLLLDKNPRILRAYQSGLLVQSKNEIKWVPNSQDGSCIALPVDPLDRAIVNVTPTIFGIELPALSFSRNQLYRKSKGVLPYLSGEVLHF